MRLSPRILAICAAIYLLSQIAFLAVIQFPVGYNFDEFHYVPAAKQYLAFEEPRNMEHPPLGKWLMAASISVFGDRPIGWRFASTVFGALTLVAMFLWGLALFGDLPIALWIMAITVVNQLLYVQARIGMLDTFMFGFLSWGLAAFTWSWDPKHSNTNVRKLWAFTGVMLGLATACKWFAIVPWFGCLGLVILVRLMQRSKIHFGDAHPDDWYSPALWSTIPGREVFTWLLVIPFLAYYATFLPFLFFSKNHWNVWDLLILQVNMYSDQLRVVNSHPYMSTPSQWPLMSRPIWYAFDHETDDHVRGVILLGNPLIMWSGLLALVACFWGWITTRGRAAFLILAFYFMFYASWILIPRKIEFYYYYYPAGMVLSFALAYVFFNLERGTKSAYPLARWTYWGVATILFVYFFPILAGLRIPGGAFVNWMWFRSWI